MNDVEILFPSTKTLIARYTSMGQKQPGLPLDSLIQMLWMSLYVIRTMFRLQRIIPIFLLIYALATFSMVQASTPIAVVGLAVKSGIDVFLMIYN